MEGPTHGAPKIGGQKKNKKRRKRKKKRRRKKEKRKKEKKRRLLLRAVVVSFCVALLGWASFPEQVCRAVRVGLFS